MAVHERIAALPTADMDVTENGSAPTGVYDPEWVVGLLDTMAEGDLDATAHAAGAAGSKAPEGGSGQELADSGPCGLAKSGDGIEVF